MPDPSRLRRIPWWASALDVLTLALLALAAWAFVMGDGPHGHIAGIRISLTSELRLSVAAAFITAIRHLAFHRPTLWDRLKPASDWMFTPGASRPLSANNRFDCPGTGRLRFRELGLVAALMVVLTAIITYPQIVDLDAVTDLGDPLFSIWRLAWIAHQLPRDPLHLFDANIFYPTRVTLAYSDSTLLPGLAAAPFIWLGVPPAAVHSLFLLASFVLAGTCMYVFVRSLTGQRPAALVAGVAFAFYPYRLDQYCHFEQMFSFWMPLALWALHRTVAYARVKDGLLTGAAIAAQYLSGMYLGAFFVAWLVPVWAFLALRSGKLRSSVKPLLAGAGLTVILAAPVAIPYLQARQAVGERRPEEVEFYSARPVDYLVSRADRLVYEDSFGRGPHKGEKDLFPGVLILVLAVVGLWPPLSGPRLAYAAALVFAFDASLGMHGHLFPFLYWHFVPFRGFRVPARFSMLVGASLVVLAGYGVARLTSGIRAPALRGLVAGALVAGFTVDAWCDRAWKHVPQPPAVYRWFAGRPPAVIEELPAMVDEQVLYDPECRYIYFSTFHWQHLLNGYSGAFPVSYAMFRHFMQTFPDDRSVALLRKQGADYVVLHEDLYGRERYRDVVNAVGRRTDWSEVSRATDNGYEARIYRAVK